MSRQQQHASVARQSRNRSVPKKPQWDSTVVIEDHNTDKLTAKRVETDSHNPTTFRSVPYRGPLEKRPPFNLDTRIDGYDDVDENGRYRRKQGDKVWQSQRQAGKQQQQDNNDRWTSSLRDDFYRE